MKAAFVLAAALLSLPPSSAPGRNEGARKYLAKDQPVRITSDRLTVFNKENRAVFVGNVVARQGELTVRSREMVALYRPGGGLASLVATGRVRVRKGDRRAVGERLEYDQTKRLMVLTGAPKVWQRDNFLEGDRVLLWVDEDRVEVERARGQLKIEERK
jgi:lipopolysaccharide export system protein LptA